MQLLQQAMAGMAEGCEVRSGCGPSAGWKGGGERARLLSCLPRVMIPPSGVASGRVQGRHAWLRL